MATFFRQVSVGNVKSSIHVSIVLSSFSAKGYFTQSHGAFPLAVASVLKSGYSFLRLCSAQLFNDFSQWSTENVDNIALSHGGIFFTVRR